MKINIPDMSPERSALRVTTRAGAYTGSLKEGDVVKAEVLSSDKSSVVLRTQDGRVFKAALEAGVALAGGDEVLLEVTGKESGVIYMALRYEALSGRDDDPQMLVRGYEDHSLLPYAAALARLGLDAGEGTAAAMRNLMIRYPAMTLDEAAFIAANRLDTDESLVNAALALLSGDEKTDEMIARLLALLGAASPEQPSVGSPDNGRGAAAVPGQPIEADALLAGGSSVITASMSASGEQAATTAQTFPLSPGDSAVLNGFLALLSEQMAASAAGPGTAAASDLRIIPQNDVDLQTGIASNVEENSYSTNFGINNRVESGDLPAFLQQEAASALNGEAAAQVGAAPAVAEQPNAGAAVSAAGGAAEQSALAAEQAAVPAAQAETQAEPAASGSAGLAAAGAAGPATSAASAEAATAASAEAAAASASQPPDGTAQAAGGRFQVSEWLSSLPEFRSTPRPALDRFSDMLMRIAGDAAAAPQDTVERLREMLQKLFTGIGSGEAGAGERLKNAREELYARLALIEEQAVRASPRGGSELLDRTRRLMDHVRLLNSVDRFAYMQLPIIMGDERRTAELYIFKRKGGGKKFDPENVNILLALDLTYMGRLEALLNIRDKDVSVKMEVRGEEERSYFSDNTVLLHEMLAEAGFKLVNTAITCSAKETTPITALAPSARAAGGRIDYVV